uniref:Claudin-4 n=1 Tax=Salmo salar TaxID=8030 RepID=B9EN17_SALSA|nr:Claudin-4 [Salmo salar]
MVSQGIQIMGIIMSLIGWLMVIIVCALPMWKVTAFIGANIVTAQTIWEGMWMNCVVQSTGQMQCKVYDSMLALPQDLQAARAMIIISILTGIVGIFLSIAGGKCTSCSTAADGRGAAVLELSPQAGPPLSGQVLSGQIHLLRTHAICLRCSCQCHVKIYLIKLNLNEDTKDSSHTKNSESFKSQRT